MANENIELVDRDYEKCPKENMPRQIKTRSSSFSEIRSKFDDFRLNFYNKQLDRMIDKTIGDTYTDDNIERKIATRSRIIAELEKKIKILSNEDVPAKYVKNRAIKLRNNMMNNAVKNSSGIYLNLESKDIRDEEVSPINVDLGNVDTDTADVVDLDVSSDSINRDSMEQIINDSFVDIENFKDKKPDDQTMFVGSNAVYEDISDEINNGNTVFVSPEEVEKAVSNTDVSVTDEVTQNNDGIPNVIGVPNVSDTSNKPDTTGFIDIDEPKIPSVPEIPETQDNPVDNVEINSDMIREEINNALNNVKVSKSESSFVRSDKFDNNGHIRVKKSYTPMSDDEIAKSQEKINSLKDDSMSIDKVSPASMVLDNKVPFEDLFVPAETVDSFDKTPIKHDTREMPEVVPDRDEGAHDLVIVPTEKEESQEKIPEFVFDDVDDDKISEDIHEVEDTPEVVKSESSTSYSSKIDEYNTLRKKALDLKQKVELTRKNKAKAQDSANQIAMEAEKTKQEADRVQRSLDDSVKKLRKYCDELEQDCNDAIKETTIIENDMKMNTNFIEYQQGKVDENKRIIAEIDALIEGNEEDTAKKHR